MSRIKSKEFYNLWMYLAVLNHVERLRIFRAVFTEIEFDCVELALMDKPAMTITIKHGEIFKHIIIVEENEKGKLQVLRGTSRRELVTGSIVFSRDYVYTKLKEILKNAQIERRKAAMLEAQVKDFIRTGGVQKMHELMTTKEFCDYFIAKFQKEMLIKCICTEINDRGVTVACRIDKYPERLRFTFDELEQAGLLKTTEEA